MSGIAFVFPGQGSQALKMLSCYDGLPEVRETYEQASAAVGADLQAAAVDGTGMDDTAVVQPLMVAAGVGAYRAWLAAGGERPAAVAGHSVGEYAALVAAEVLDLQEALQLVAARAAAMGAAVAPGAGAMQAVLGLTCEQVDECCRRHEQVWVANRNGRLQTVIAGDKDAVAAAAQDCLAAGAKRVVELAVAVPSHCPLMKPAAQALEKNMAKAPFREPRVPVIHNCDNRPRSQPDEIRRALLEQLSAQIDWPGAITALRAHAEAIIECGPGRVLNNLNRRIAPDLTCASLHDAAALRELAARLQ